MKDSETEKGMIDHVYECGSECELVEWGLGFKYNSKIFQNYVRKQVYIQDIRYFVFDL